MKWIFGFAVFLLFACEPKTDIAGKVIKVKDGDSIVVLDSLRKQHEIRLAYIDAPERYQDFGQQSKNYLSDLVFGKNVGIIIIEPSDRYGRIIAEVIVSDSVNVNKAMLAAGMAWHFDQYPGTFIHERLERKAKRNKAGLWANPNAIPPWEFRRKK